MSTALKERGRPAARERGAGYRAVYLWHWPIRAMHWLAAGSVGVLAFTGLYIGRPYFMTTGQASDHFLMGWMRFLHFAAAGVLVATAIVRFYWLFRGNRFERWRALFPVRPRDLKNLLRQMRYYALIRPEDAPHYLGHNPLQQLSYTGIYAAAGVMVVTGFALYGLHDPGGFFFVTFGWVAEALGGWQVVRFVHHVTTWIFLAFLPVHVYFAVRADVTEREGSVSAMVGGFRFVRDDVRFVDEEAAEEVLSQPLPGPPEAPGGHA